MKGVESLLLVLLSVHFCASYNVLVIFPFPGRSHSILGYGHVDRLLEAGHEVTFITPFPKKNTNPKLRIIDISENRAIIPEDNMNLEKILDKTTSHQNFTRFYQMITDVDELTFKHVNVQKMLHDDNIKFDLVLAEWMMSEFGGAYAAYYNVPFISFASTEPHSLVLRTIDDATNPAYVPTILSSAMPPFGFIQRVQELFFDVFLQIFCDFFIGRRIATFYAESFATLIAKQGRVPPSYSDIRYNASLLLGNSHVSLGSAIRLPQNYKAIGGYHINTNVPPLPEDLQRIFDLAQDGVIYFSMGSNLKSKYLPDDMKADLLKLFGSLKQTVLWKFEEVLPNLPKNVHILQWAPQPSILAHPKTKIFITHGGLLSTTETIHFGVPTIGIPVFGDQFTNVDRSVKKGFALRVDLSYDLVADLKVAIKEMLEESKYSKKAKELSLVYHDRPVPPGRELVHWVEHVIKTNGAPHLRSPALLVPWYQKIFLDLAAVVIAITFLIKKLVKRLCCRKTVDIKKKKRD